jgi:hypothetical protein
MGWQTTPSGSFEADATCAVDGKVFTEQRM